MKKNAAPKDRCSVQSTASVCAEHFAETTGLAAPTKHSLPHHSDKCATNERLPLLWTEALPRQRCTPSEESGQKLEQFSSEEDSWDSVIDGPLSSQLLEQHKMCEDSLLEIMNCDTDDLLATI